METTIGPFIKFKVPVEKVISTFTTCNSYNCLNFNEDLTHAFFCNQCGKKTELKSFERSKISNIHSILGNLGMGEKFNIIHPEFLTEGDFFFESSQVALISNMIIDNIFLSEKDYIIYNNKYNIVEHNINKFKQKFSSEIKLLKKLDTNLSIHFGIFNY